MAPNPHPSRLVPLARAAEIYGCSDRTVRRMIARGALAGYRLPASRLIRVDLDELDQALRVLPTA